MLLKQVRRQGLLIGLLAIALVSALPSLSLMSTVLAATTITGTVFQDYNANGTQDTTTTVTNNGAGTIGTAIDPGISGVTVTAYDATGAAVGTATTIANGTYSLGASGSGPYRVEFTNLPTGYQPSQYGSNSGTTVQFVASGATTNISLGINRPGDYCQNNPDLAVPCYTFGDQINNTNPAFVTLPYAAGSNRTTGGAPITDYTNPTTHALMLQSSQVGSTFGAAYARQSRKIYMSAFMKRHSGFGPGGTGAIYVYDRATSTLSTINLNTIFGTAVAGANLHDTANYNTDNGNTGWDAVGKNSFGGMALSADETKLYVMNLADRKLYEVPLNAAPTTANIRTVDVPLAPPNCPLTDNAKKTGDVDVRPFAVQFYEGKIYVGTVCSAESSQSANDLYAYVYTVDPTAFTFSANPVFQTALNYTRGVVDPGVSAAWAPWATTFTNRATNTNAIYPQPWLTDIAFDKGNLILGLRDRIGDQSGFNSPSNPASTTTTYHTIVGGDTLRACGNPTGGWTLENNARCGGTGTGTQNTNQGPGGGEFYFADDYHPNGVPHQQVSMGTLAQLPGFPDVAATVFDPAYLPNDDLYDRGGFRWFNNTTGGYTKGYELYQGNFGKANGLGDVAPLCDAAPIEIGNRVWRDSNANGVQDPGEPPIAGVTVRLYQGSTLVGTATTDAQGQYLFNTSNVTGGVKPNTTYNIQLDQATDYATGGVLASAKLTTANVSGNAQDLRDSDATLATPANPIGAGNYPTITLTTGGAGFNDHTQDFGVFQPGTVSGVVFNDLNGNTTQNTGEPGIGGVTVELLNSSNTVVATTATAGDGTYSFSNVAPGSYTVRETDPATYASVTSNTVSVSIVSGSAATANFADQQQGTVTGKVFNDLNGNGLQGPGENGISGVTVQLLNSGGTVIATTTTATDGSYSFSSVGVGSYTVRETDPTGYVSTSSNTVNVSVPANGAATANFGDQQQGTVSGRVFNDANGNGVRDGSETGISSVTVQLLNSSGAVVDTASTLR